MKNLKMANAINQVSSDIKWLKDFASIINTITEEGLDGQNITVNETYQSFSDALDTNRIVVKNIKSFEENIKV